MSDAPFDPTGQQGGQDQPSEEEVRAYLGQLRAAPVDQVVAELLQGLLSAAQVKLGRRDGRLLLDVVADVVERTRAHLDAQLISQVDDVLAQLRVAQVQAEKEVAEAASQGHEEPSDLGGDGAPAPSTGGTAPQQSDEPPSPPSSAGPSAADRLWVPGR